MKVSDAVRVHYQLCFNEHDLRTKATEKNLAFNELSEKRDVFFLFFILHIKCLHTTN